MSGDTDPKRRVERLDALDAAADECLDATRWRDYMLRVAHAGFISAGLIASPAAVVNAYAFYILGLLAEVPKGRLDEGISRWLFGTLLTARYSGSSETKFEEDLARMRDRKTRQRGEMRVVNPPRSAFRTGEATGEGLNFLNLKNEADQRVLPALDIEDIARRTVSLVIGQTIPIPRILVLPRGIARSGFRPFTLSLDGLHFQPPEDDLWLQYLQSGKSAVVGLGAGGIKEARPEDVIIRGLIDFNDVSYDNSSEVLYDLAAQVVKHLRSYLQGDEVSVLKVLHFHQRQIADFVHVQMQPHYWDDLDVRVRLASAIRAFAILGSRLRRGDTSGVTNLSGRTAHRMATLRHVSDESPGIRRRRAGAGVVYVAPSGRRVRDARTLERIRSIVIPPAWDDVWICPSPDGHIQATGRDARGRKQYRYHSAWTARRDEAKYDHLIDFGRALPKIRRRIAADLKCPVPARERVLATVVRLLEKTLIRIGNDEYARANHSYGLTTFRNRHVKVRGRKLAFDFRAKSGLLQHVDLEEATLAGIVKTCQELPGQTLFEYIDTEGAIQRVDSSEVNSYLREIAGADFTAKDFRTWGGTLLAACALSEIARDKPARSATGRNRHVVAAIDYVARALGNTRSVCRKCYVHPAVLDLYLERGDTLTVPRAPDDVAASRRLVGNSTAERALLSFLRALKRGERGRVTKR